MARETITVEKIDIDSLNATYTTMTVDGIAFLNSNKTFLHIVAPSAAVITIITPYTANEGLALEDRIISIAIGEEVFVGPFSPKIYEQNDGTIFVNSDQLDTDIAALKV